MRRVLVCDLVPFPSFRVLSRLVLRPVCRSFFAFGLLRFFFRLAIIDPPMAYSPTPTRPRTDLTATSHLRRHGATRHRPRREAAAHDLATTRRWLSVERTRHRFALPPTRPRRCLTATCLSRRSGESTGNVATLRAHCSIFPADNTRFSRTYHLDTRLGYNFQPYTTHVRPTGRPCRPFS